MEGKFTFENNDQRKAAEKNSDFQGEYIPETITLDDLKERMKKVVGAE